MDKCFRNKDVKATSQINSEACIKKGTHRHSMKNCFCLIAQNSCIHKTHMCIVKPSMVEQPYRMQLVTQRCSLCLDTAVTVTVEAQCPHREQVDGTRDSDADYIAGCKLPLLTPNNGQKLDRDGDNLQITEFQLHFHARNHPKGLHCSLLLWNLQILCLATGHICCQDHIPVPALDSCRIPSCIVRHCTPKSDPSRQGTWMPVHTNHTHYHHHHRLSKIRSIQTTNVWQQMLRKISEPENDAIKEQFMLLHNEKLCNLCMPPGIVKVAKFRKLW